MSSSNGLVYLDYAATSAVRPQSVARAVADYLTSVGATPGRGGHRLAIESGRVALRCRQRIAFMFNATHALNTALSGLVRRGDALVVTAFDHNSVLRPAYRLVEERGVRLTVVPGQADGSLDEAVFARALEGARLLVVTAG